MSYDQGICSIDAIGMENELDEAREKIAALRHALVRLIESCRAEMADLPTNGDFRSALDYADIVQETAK